MYQEKRCYEVQAHALALASNVVEIKQMVIMSILELEGAVVYASL